MLARLALILCIVSVLAASATARADVVGWCPPTYSSSHSGCHFDPQPHDLVYLACCGGPLVVAVIAGIVLVSRKRRAGDRPPDA